MHGFRGIISKFFPRMVQEVFLAAIAILTALLFICAWPQRFLILRQYLPREMSMKWFMSFASLNTLTNIQSAQYYNDLAGSYYKQGKFDQAIAGYDKAIEIGAAFTAPYYNRGYLYFIRGDYGAAAKDFIKVIKMDPKFVATYGNLGFIYAKQGQFIQAISVFTKAVKIDPKYAPAYNGRDILYYHLKQYDKAWEDVHQAEKLGVNVDPDFINLLKKDSGRDK